MKVAIMGAGAIGSTMARTINELKHPEITLYAVASRSLEKATAFARDFRVPKAYGSYTQMLEDPEVDLVYIATPHSEHYENAKACIAHHKAMLIEKSFTANTAQAKEILDLAASEGVFVTEAIWTRYMPSRTIIKGILERGELGKISSVEANLSYNILQKKRITDPALAGGALLDLGVYPINFAMMFLGHEVEDVTGVCVKGPTGVDVIDNISMRFKDGTFASLVASACSPSARMGYIYGETGYLAVTNINNPEKIELFNKNHELVKSYEVPKQVSGYEYEVISCLMAMKSGKKCCPEMLHQETLDVMSVMDKLRAQWNIRFPFEKTEPPQRKAEETPAKGSAKTVKGFLHSLIG